MVGILLECRLIGKITWEAREGRLDDFYLRPRFADLLPHLAVLNIVNRVLNKLFF